MKPSLCESWAERSIARTRAKRATKGEPTRLFDFELGYVVYFTSCLFFVMSHFRQNDWRFWYIPDL